MDLAIVLSRRARRELNRLAPEVARRVVQAVERLAQTGQGDMTRLTDVKRAEYRLRIGDWRVRYTLDPAAGVLTVLRILPRGEAYR